MKIKLSMEIKKIIDIVHKQGFDIFVVGGYIRDKILKKKTYDVDMTTNATPSEIKEILKDYKLNDKYEKYGCIKFKNNKYNFEITTYRKEFNYTNHRCPSNIEYTKSLKDDLIRRDFTMNALCCNGKQFIDEFGGLNDIKNKKIKMIGNPYNRFEEDALRILRALRFSSKLNFDIDDDLKKIIKEKFFLLKHLNFDVLHSELIGILNGKDYIRVLKDYKEQLIDLFELNKLDIVLFDNKMLIEEKEALLFYYSNKKINNIYLENKNIVIGKDKISLKKSLKKYGKDKIYNILHFKSKYLKEEIATFNLLNEILINKECYNLRMLKVNGNDLIKLNIEKEKIGEILNNLLDAVIDGKCSNTKKMLFNHLKSYIL